jgi:ribosomal protein S18 acetylase RimI-like enzyme
MSQPAITSSAPGPFLSQIQGQGVGAALMHHLATTAEAGLQGLIAEVLPDNAAMLKVFEKSGFLFRMQREHE